MFVYLKQRLSVSTFGLGTYLTSMDFQNSFFSFKVFECSGTQNEVFLSGAAHLFLELERQQKDIHNASLLPSALPHTRCTENLNFSRDKSRQVSLHTYYLA